MLSKTNYLAKFALNRPKLLSCASSSSSILLKPTFSHYSVSKIRLPSEKHRFGLLSLCAINQNSSHHVVYSRPQVKLVHTDKLKNEEKPVAKKESILDSSLLSSTVGAQDSNKSSANSDKNADPNQPKQGFSKFFSREHGWKVSLGFIFALIGGGVVYFLATFGPEKLDEENKPIKDEFSEMSLVIQYPYRAVYALFDIYNMMKKPSTDKLLPDPIQPPYYQPPYTLVIEMTGILLHPEWTFSTGWRYKKRPGLDYFIEQVKYPLFEVVLFTREPFLSAAPIAASLDPQQQIHYKLFRESTQFINNNFVKDLSYMNRDPSKIIVIDWDEKAYQLQPRNALHRLKKWTGDETDADLVYLASFLKLIANSGVSDVREVLDFYNKELDPLEAFKIKQVQIKEAELQRQEELKAIKEKQASKYSLFRR